MQISQTPFEILHRKDRQRKMSLLNSIEIRQRNKKMLNCNIKYQEHQATSLSEQETKSEAKEPITNITVSNSIKKSYYYRKLLNRSIDTPMTCEEFSRVKNKFDKINIKHISNQNKSFFREIWEQDHENKSKQRVSNERYSSEYSGNHENEKAAFLEEESESKRKGVSGNKVKNIIEIAHERRLPLYKLNLQIMGNKHSIQIKSKQSKLHQDSKQTINPQQLFVRCNYSTGKKNISLDFEQNTNQEAPSPLFKKFQEEGNSKKPSPAKITIFPANTDNQLISPVFKQLRLKQFHSQQQSKKKTSPWRPTTTYVSHRDPQISPRRSIFSKANKSRPQPQLNDIKGWLVGQQNQAFLSEYFDN